MKTAWGVFIELPSSALRLPPPAFAAFFIYLLFTPLAVHALSAFPGAEGFGTTTTGGRGGRVIHVTNLNDSGAGSFRDAVMQDGPRIIVFDVSGTIQLQSGISVVGPSKSFLTIAGQSSPGGIQIKGPGAANTTGGDPGIYFNDGAHDIVVRFLRVRLGGPNPFNTGGVGVYAPNSSRPSYNVVFDHNSIEWSTDDDAISCGYAYTNDCTMSWNLIAEDYLPSMGAYSYYDDARISVHHNVSAHATDSRNPRIPVGIADYRNNIHYNYYSSAGLDAGEWLQNRPLHLNFVNNMYIAGVNSYQPKYMVLENGGPTRIDGKAAGGGGTKVYFTGNWGPNCPSGCADDWTGHQVRDWDYTFMYDPWPDPFPLATFARYGASTAFAAPAVTTFPTNQLLTKILPTVGAYKPSRDSVDTRIVNDVTNRTGSNNFGNGGPWPTLTGPSAPTDSDQDGMPNAWETAHGLNPNNAADGAAVSSNGYTHVENYLNELAGDVIPGNPYGPSVSCDLNTDGSTNVSDVQMCVNQGLGISSCSTGDINKDGLCNVVDVQRVVNAALGGQCVSP